MAMTAIVPREAGGPEVLEQVTRELPEPAQGQVRIRVAAAGINRHDCNQRGRGHRPEGATDILGLEVSGTIDAVGEGVDRGRIGAQVAALVNGGGYAEYVVADEPMLFDWTPRLSAVEAGALPEALMTLQLNLSELCALDAGEWLLIHGGTSGIGMAGIPLNTTGSTQEGVRICVSLIKENQFDELNTRLSTLNHHLQPNSV